MSVFCSIPVLGALIASCDPPPPLATGYVEGEYLLIAPVETARIETVSVRRGDRFAAGAALAKMERKDADIAVAQAIAALAQANSQLADLRIGKRPEEIAMVEAALNSALAQHAEAERKAKRAGDLARRGIAAQADLDTASTAVELASAKVAELEANLAVANLPARPDQIAAAEAARKQAEAALETAQWRLANRTLSAPSAGTVSDILREAGEVAGPQAPVLTVLPDGAVKLKLYVSELSIAVLATGTKLKVRCDGCGDGLTATVNYIASDPEFTPPVIYSLENRQKLVYLVEARPDRDATALKPGQIVDVELETAQR
jgi:HlyD family secretion protein